jgi:hypothetical protein
MASCPTEDSILHIHCCENLRFTDVAMLNMLAKYVAAGQQFERIYEYVYGIPSATVLEWKYFYCLHPVA